MCQQKNAQSLIYGQETGLIANHFNILQIISDLQLLHSIPPQWSLHAEGAKFFQTLGKRTARYGNEDLIRKMVVQNNLETSDYKLVPSNLIGRADGMRAATKQSDFEKGKCGEGKGRQLMREVSWAKELCPWPQERISMVVITAA